MCSSHYLPLNINFNVNDNKNAKINFKDNTLIMTMTIKKYNNQNFTTITVTKLSNTPHIATKNKTFLALKQSNYLSSLSYIASKMLVL